MNKLAVESKIRQGSIIDMTKGDTKAIKLDTLTKILDTLNSISKEQGKREIELTDILEYVTDESNNEAANE
jgi:DNA-binding Xre family transcriptional regulator